MQGWVISCSPIAQKSMHKTLLASEERFQDHTGFIIVDAEKRKTIFEFQSGRYFTPASNTKILTLFSCLHLMTDSVPALRYVEREDSLIFWGTGDPSFLNKMCFNNEEAWRFLATCEKSLFFSTTNFFTARFGPGWAWDDYNDYYAQERSSFPLYGNSFSIFPLPDQILVTPAYFRRFMQVGEQKARYQAVRDITSNAFVFHPAANRAFREVYLPFHVQDNFIGELLSDTLKKPVTVVSKEIPSSARTIYSIPTDSLYKVMMQRSDNFIAEQLLLLCAGILSDSLDTEIAIRHVTENYFKDAPDAPVWKDGSGLSRYNLLTPRFAVWLWQKIYEKMPEERLFEILPAGGKSGTIKNLFKADTPYIFAKTGTLSNNHSLSGFLITKKGKRLIFSFMNSNFTAPVREVRENMQRILNLYYENY
jgi:serine-type D-Ala-D-Ala carboxypeptidase/endopeptidase (penicillin-binding protein 4)